MQAEPVEGEGANMDGWPDDVPALRVAFALLQSGRQPTRRNFIALGLNSGSRYDVIRAWLVDAGLAQNAGDGNPTPWTTHAYQPDVQRAIEEFLLPTSLSV